MRPHDWAFFAALGAMGLGLVALGRGELSWALAWTVAAGAAGWAARVWSRKYPGPMPHAIRWVLFMPRGPHSPARLERILQPRTGERFLEIGPGIGTHALPIAAALGPDGVLDVLDVQPAMLADLRRRAEAAGIANIAAQQGDARRLPYPDCSFDGAYLVTVLGEIPDEVAALRELRRVVKPIGRLVVGEFLVDPDFIPLSTLKRKASAAGWVLEATTGPRFAYFARFRPAVTTPRTAGTP